MIVLSLIYLWNLGFALSSDTPPTGPLPQTAFDENAYAHVKKGDLVWVKSGHLHHFYLHIFPKIQEPFILIVNDGDESFPRQQRGFFDVDKLIASEKVLHIFSQNYSLETPHPKISPLPIGLDLHTLTTTPKLWKEKKATPEEQERALEAILKKLKPTHKRKMRIFADFQHNDSLRNGPYKRYLELGEDRKTIFNTISATGLVDHSSKKLRRSNLWKKKAEYAFSVSPQGNGMDCHRTWEDLILGCIVIVKTSPIDPLYEGLPVVIIKDWSEITKENLARWHEQYADAFTNPAYREKLTHTYWMAKIKAKQTFLRGASEAARDLKSNG